MKRILITGKDSYIGTNFKKYLELYPDDYYVEELDVKDNAWMEFDFSGFDVVFHVAGIAHIKESKDKEQLYYKVNRDLAISVAKKAKSMMVKQFVFMSSMSVYGLLFSNELVGIETSCMPNTYYGKSKYEAEKMLEKLGNATFKICIIRPPMVYGDNSPGNLSKLFKVVKKVHIFPMYHNQRSSITVGRLVEYIKVYIDNGDKGVKLPQNKKYMCTFDIVKEKMKDDDVKVIYVSFFNFLIKILIGRIDLITKCFGDLKYGE